MPEIYEIPEGVSVRKYGNKYTVWYQGALLRTFKTGREADRFAARLAVTWAQWEHFLTQPTHYYAYHAVRQL